MLMIRKSDLLNHFEYGRSLDRRVQRICIDAEIERIRAKRKFIDLNGLLEHH